MAKKNKILSIDLDQWTTQAKKAATYKTPSGKGCSQQYISRLIKIGKLKSLFIPELGINLVEK